jgi:hypothetical protein
VSGGSKETEVRRLLRKALSRVRRKALSADVRPALNLDLNDDDLEDRRDDVLMYFIGALVLFGILFLTGSFVRLF